MNIVTYSEGVVKPSQGTRTTDPEAYDLALGQYWEEVVASALTANGLPAYRLKQWFIPSDLLQWNSRMEDRCCRVKRYKGQIVSTDFKPELLRPYQRDVLVKIGKVKRLTVEVKALQPEAFRQHYIHFGECPKWDEKMFKVDAIVLVNQATGAAWTILTDPAEWVRKESKNGSGMDYAIHRSQLTPLEAWIDAVKDIQALSQEMSQAFDS